MSEFGEGVIVPLVKFSEHMGDYYTSRIEKAIRWIKAEPSEREDLMEEDDPEWILVLKLDEMASSSEKMLDDMITLWAYGASDHLSNLDRQRAPQSLNDLADLMWELRYPSVDGLLHGEEDWVRALALWSAAAMDLDEMMGVRSDWGDW